MTCGWSVRCAVLGWFVFTFFYNPALLFAANSPPHGDSGDAHIGSEVAEPKTCEARRVLNVKCVDGPKGAACRNVEESCRSISNPPPLITPEQLNTLKTALVAIGIALIGAAATAITGWAQNYSLKKNVEKKENEIEEKQTEIDKKQKEIKSLENRALDPFFPRPDDYDQYATNMIIIGEGGSGKTTLLYALTASEKARPDYSTAQRAAYTLVHEITMETKNGVERRLQRIYSDDYVGQNWLMGTSNPDLTMRQKYVKASVLVIVVDLVAPGSKEYPAKRRESLDTDRIADQLKIYNQPAIQTLLALVGPKAHIVLFINKIDLIYPCDDTVVEAAKAAYDPLRKTLSGLRGVAFDVIVGSAATGMGVVGYWRENALKLSILEILSKSAERIDVEALRRSQNG